MIAEIAMTLGLFEKEVNPDADQWVARLRRLGSLLLTNKRPQSIVVADLYAGGWLAELKKICDALDSEPKASALYLKVRPLMDRLYPQINALASRRAPTLVDWPDSDLAWAREAIASHGRRELQRIATTGTSLAAVRGECDRVCSLDDLIDGSFRDTIATDWSPRLVVGEQVELLRPLLRQADFIDLVLPHAAGTSNDETPFAAAVLREFKESRTAGERRSAAIHVQVAGNRSPAESTYSVSVENTCANVIAGLRQLVDPAFAVRVHVWGKLLDRYLIAGKGIHVPPGVADDRRVIWALHMGHIVRPTDLTPGAGSPRSTEWHMKSRDLVAGLFEQYSVDLAPPKVYRTEVVIPQASQASASQVVGSAWPRGGGTRC